jgi:UDP-N-acetylglucosamine--N-acetylmuramyl-(pentapeptide) pyrophosphoryl-undecaprenol N-acetylglucosamine transferase
MSFDNITDIFKAIRGLILAQWYIWRFMPDVTFGKGGYASVPGVIVSWIYQVPIVIHESDSVPGLANKFLGRFASIVCVAFRTAKTYFPERKTSLVGNMTSSDITEGTKEKAYELFDLTFEKPVLLVVGGSQGAQSINTSIWTNLSKLVRFVEIIHIVGPQNGDEAKSFYRSLGTYESRFYHYETFLTHELKHAYAVSDLVLSRAGASSIADICLTGNPSILVPLVQGSNGHQRSNAYEMAEGGASIVIEQQNLTPNLFLTQIEELIKQPKLMEKMATRASQMATPQASYYVSQQIFKLLQ